MDCSFADMAMLATSLSLNLLLLFWLRAADLDGSGNRAEQARKLD
jgi:hypothetical protein